MECPKNELGKKWIVKETRDRRMTSGQLRGGTSYGSNQGDRN